jgi:ABC-type multidrug transport system fused ATPase/permease subunit
MTWIGGRVVADLRDQTFRRLLEHPPSFFHERQSGELISRLTSDIEMLHHAVGSELSIFLRSMLTATGGLAILFATSPSLSLAMIAIVPPTAITAVIIGRLIRRQSRAVQDELASANRRLKEAIVGVDTVQAFTAEEREASSYGQRVFAAFAQQLSLALARGGFMGGMAFASYAAVAAIVYLGALAVIDGELSPGELAGYLLYTIMIAGAMGSLAQVWANLQSALGATGRVFELLDEEPAIADAPDARPLPAPRGRVAFEDVSFYYPSRPEVPVLSDVSFAAEPGEMVALVGHSGAGKSTIAALTMRFQDPQRGAVTIDGHDVRKLRLADLRRLIAPVSQEPMLFSGTIGDNIAYGAPGASAEAIAQAAADAMIAEFVDSLPQGYDTLVGERGVKLSGGQRQRIAIARAMLADPRVLILDEATSHLDTENEALVQKALVRLMKGRTTLVIAHRLSTIQAADRILVLDGGRVVERGTHDELMAADTVYRRLTTTQAVLG